MSLLDLFDPPKPPEPKNAKQVILVDAQAPVPYERVTGRSEAEKKRLKSMRNQRYWLKHKHGGVK